MDSLVAFEKTFTLVKILPQMVENPSTISKYSTDKRPERPHPNLAIITAPESPPIGAQRLKVLAACSLWLWFQSFVQEARQSNGLALRQHSGFLLSLAKQPKTEKVSLTTNPLASP